jgi:hypothetical protein
MGLYLKLRDDPSVINSATLTAEELPAPPPPTDTTPPPTPPTAGATPAASGAND